MLQQHARRVIGLDYDGTLIDIHTVWAREYAMASGHVGFSPTSILSWDYSKYILPGWGDRYTALRTPGLYLLARPVPGAVNAVRELARQGHTLVCVTHDTQPYLKVKRAQLARFFPDVRLLVLAQEKSCVRLDILVDDGLHNKPTNLVPQPWNSAPNRNATWADRQGRFWRELPLRFACC